MHKLLQILMQNQQVSSLSACPIEKGSILGKPYTNLEDLTLTIISWLDATCFSDLLAFLYLCCTTLVVVQYYLGCAVGIFELMMTKDYWNNPDSFSDTIPQTNIGRTWIREVGGRDL